MARPISASHDQRRDEILDVAAACFARQSYPATRMNDIAAACSASKARLYHYYESMEAILFDLLDRYTQKLLVIIGQVQATAHRQALDERATLHALIRAFLREYESSATRHAALLASTQFLGDEQRGVILDRQRDVVSAVTRFLRRAYPERVDARNQTAITMTPVMMVSSPEPEGISKAQKTYLRSAQESPRTNAIMMRRLKNERSIPPFSPVAC